MENQEQKLKDLLLQLQEAGIDVKEITGKGSLDELAKSSQISKHVLDKLTSTEPAAFEAWVAWTKSF